MIKFAECFIVIDLPFFLAHTHIKANISSGDSLEVLDMVLLIWHCYSVSFKPSPRVPYEHDRWTKHKQLLNKSNIVWKLPQRNYSDAAILFYHVHPDAMRPQFYHIQWLISKNHMLRYLLVIKWLVGDAGGFRWGVFGWGFAAVLGFILQHCFQRRTAKWSIGWSVGWLLAWLVGYCSMMGKFPQSTISW